MTEGLHDTQHVESCDGRATGLLRQRYFNTDGHALSIAEGSASGPPLLLIHGIASRWQVFLPILPALCLEWHVFALDLRGHGCSSRTSGFYSLTDYVDDVITFVTSSLVGPSYLLGHSMGGAIALLVAGTIPERVVGVITGDTPLLSNQGRVPRKLRRLAAHLRLLRPLVGLPTSEILARLPDSSVASQALAETLHQTDPEVLDFVGQGRFQGFGTGIDWECTLTNIACPVLLLEADPARGGIATAEDIEYGLSVLPNAKHMLLEQAGHDLGLLTGNTANLLDAVLGFLEQLQ